MDIRLVPEMEAERAAAAIRRHLDDRGHGHVRTRVLETYPWAKAPAGNAVARAFEASFDRLGLESLPYPLAPWCAPYFVFDRLLGLPWACGGAGHAWGAHGPDEYASIEGLKQHMMGVAAFVLAYARGNG